MGGSPVGGPADRHWRRLRADPVIADRRRHPGRFSPTTTGAATVRGYLEKLLQTLWQEEEGFNGKRPFGNSGWKSDVYLALVNAGLVAGTCDADDGCLSQVDERAANALVLAAIGELGSAQRGGGSADSAAEHFGASL